MAKKLFPKEMQCPGCKASLILDENERINGEFTCPECDEDVLLFEALDHVEEGGKNGSPKAITISTEGLGDEVLKGIHGAKSYVGTAFLTLLFYYVGFYIVGLICNLVFISQANNSKRIAGSSPSGRGCLFLLIWVHLVIPILVGMILILGGALASLNC